MAAITITKEDVEKEVMNSDKPVLIDFWASWCGPCRMVSPIVEELADELTAQKVGKINIEEQPELAEAFSVMSIPTLMVIKNGKVVSKATGARPKQAILDMLEK